MICVQIKEIASPSDYFIFIIILYILECSYPLGMEDGRIKDLQITTTSGLLRGAYGRLARLNKNIPYWCAWCVGMSEGMIHGKNYDHHIMIDLLNLTKITGIATQGRQGKKGDGIEKVEDYKLSYRRDGGVWHFYSEKVNLVKVSLIKKMFSKVWCLSWSAIY